MSLRFRDFVPSAHRRDQVLHLILLPANLQGSGIQIAILHNSRAHWLLVVLFSKSFPRIRATIVQHLTRCA